jgi:hypothetical protein
MSQKQLTFGRAVAIVVSSNGLLRPSLKKVNCYYLCYRQETNVPFLFVNCRFLFQTCWQYKRVMTIHNQHIKNLIIAYMRN